MDDNIEKYSEAILQVVYNDDNNYTWIRGTAFVVLFKEKLFIVTSSHCIQEENIKDLFFSKMATTRQCFSLPITCQIKSYDKSGTEIDSDLRIFKIDDEEYYKHIIDNSEIQPLEEYSKEIIRTPFFNKLRRQYKNKPNKLMKKLTSSKLYLTLTSKQNRKIKQILENSDTSIAEIKSLNLANTFEYNKGTECSFAGYSIEKGYIETDDRGALIHGHQHLMILDGELTGDFNENSQTYTLKYETDNHLNGISGGPVWADRKVIGASSYIEENNKILHFIPVSDIKSSIDFWFEKQNRIYSTS